MIGMWGLRLHGKRSLEGRTYPRQASEASNWKTPTHCWYITLGTTCRDSFGLQPLSRAPDKTTQGLSEGAQPAGFVSTTNAHLVQSTLLSPRNLSQGLSKNNSSDGHRPQSPC